LALLFFLLFPDEIRSGVEAAIGQGFWWAVVGAGFGVYRGRFKLRTGAVAPPVRFPKWSGPLVAGVVAIGIVAAIALPAYQDYANPHTVAKIPDQAPAPPVDLSQFKPVPDVQSEDASPSLWADKQLLKKQGIGGNQELADVSAWGKAQLAARLFDGEERETANNFVLMWQRQIISILKMSPERALSLGYSIVADHFDRKMGICRPDMARSGGIEILDDDTFNSYGKCYQDYANQHDVAALPQTAKRSQIDDFLNDKNDSVELSATNEHSGSITQNGPKLTPFYGVVEEEPPRTLVKPVDRSVLGPGKPGWGIIKVLLDYPRLFFLNLIVEALPAAAIAYGLVWFVARRKIGRPQSRSFWGHAMGVMATVVGAALFRIVVMAAGGGSHAFAPTETVGVGFFQNMAFFLFIVPAFCAIAYNRAMATDDGDEGRMPVQERLHRVDIAEGGPPVDMEKSAVQEPLQSLETVNSAPPVVVPRVGRNEPCPCGSGKKYKQCTAS